MCVKGLCALWWVGTLSELIPCLVLIAQPPRPWIGQAGKSHASFAPCLPCMLHRRWTSIQQRETYWWIELVFSCLLCYRSVQTRLNNMKAPISSNKTSMWFARGGYPHITWRCYRLTSLWFDRCPTREAYQIIFAYWDYTRNGLACHIPVQHSKSTWDKIHRRALLNKEVLSI